jgi:hypothetical protein
MDGFSIPPTIFVAFGVIVAGLLAGFFSFLNLVSAKENKISEFRLAWLDGLREEIAEYTSSVRELVRVADSNIYTSQESEVKTQQELWRERHKETRDAYTSVVSSLSKIQMRLNPKHISDNPDGAEAKLMRNILHTRQLFNDRRYKEAATFSDDIREAATPLLKSTWDLVKNGEQGYQRIRNTASHVMLYGSIVTGILFVALCIASLIPTKNNEKNLNIQTLQVNLDNLHIKKPQASTEPKMTYPPLMLKLTPRQSVAAEQ